MCCLLPRLPTVARATSQCIGNSDKLGRKNERFARTNQNRDSHFDTFRSPGATAIVTPLQQGHFYFCCTQCGPQAVPAMGNTAPGSSSGDYNTNTTRQPLRLGRSARVANQGHSSSTAGLRALPKKLGVEHRGGASVPPATRQGQRRGWCLCPRAGRGSSVAFWSCRQGCPQVLEHSTGVHCPKGIWPPKCEVFQESCESPLTQAAEHNINACGHTFLIFGKGLELSHKYHRLTI